MEITTQVVTEFREYYPEFSDITTWPESSVTRQLEAAADECGSSRWGSYISSPASIQARGLYAFAAHRLSLHRVAARATQNGGVAAAANQVSGRSVNDESISYAIAGLTGGEQAAIGDLNTTIYGQEFIRLRRRVGMGAAVTQAKYL